MNKPPRWYYRVESSLHTYQEYLELTKNPIKTPEKKQALLNLIKRMYVAYWKFLKDILKENNIIEYFPINIFKTAVQNGIINKSELIWLDYIQLLNKILYEEKIDKNTIADKIIEVYAERLEIINNYMQNLYSSIKDKDKEALSIDLSYYEPIYNSSYLGIEDYAYKILLNYFKNTLSVKYVWLHGSRAIGQARYNSDIDLLIECPIENFEDIKYQIGKLRIPYRIDVSNIFDDSKKNFIIRTSKYAKIIYRKEDFNKD